MLTNTCVTYLHINNWDFQVVVYRDHEALKHGANPMGWGTGSTDMDGSFNSLRPRQNGRHFADDIFNCIFLNENVWIPIKISLKFIPKCPINNIPALVQIMAWRRPGDKPLSEPMMVSLQTHICVTRSQWVNGLVPNKRQAIIWTFDGLFYDASVCHSTSVSYHLFEIKKKSVVS